MKVRWFTNAHLIMLSLALFFRPATAPATTVGTLTATATPVTVLNTGGEQGASGEGLSSGQWVAAQFTITDPTAITDVQAFVDSYSQSGGAVNIVIWTNNNSDPTYPIPGTAIWTQSYTITVPASPGNWVNFPGYLAVLAPGTYWVAFEGAKGSTLNVGMGLATTPAESSAFFDGGINTWINMYFGTNHSTNYPAVMLSGYDLGTDSGAPLITSGTFARTVGQGSIFNSPCGQNLGPYGNIGQADTLQWNICPGIYSASAYGTITANPKTAQGNILEAGAYSATGPNGSSGAARGIVFSTYLNTTGKDIPNVQANAALSGLIAGASSNSPVTVSAAVYVFDTAAFTSYINSVVPDQYPTLGWLLLGGSSVVAGQGSYYEPNLGLLFPSYVDDSWDNNSQFEVCNGTNCAQGYEVSTEGFDLPANALFTVMFDVTAASEGANSAQSTAIGDFLSTLQADPQYFFTDGNTSVNNGLGNVITGIAGPLTVALPDTPANISLSPSTQSTAVGSTTVVTATVTDASNNPVPDAIVRFSVTSGPHSGFTMPVGTGDGNNGTTLGVATFTYTDTLGTAGTDSISASVGSISAPTPTQVTWTAPGPLYTITLTPPTNSIALGNSQTYDATGTDFFGNSVGDVTSQLTFTISPDGTCAAATCTPALAGPHIVTGTSSNPVVGTITGTASLTVNSSSLSTPTISFGAAPTPTYLGGNFTVSATTNSNGALTYTYVSGPCAPVSGGTFSPTGAGICVIQANTVATSTYSAGSAQQTVTIGPATATISFGTAPSPTYLGGNFTVSATTNSTGAVTYSYVSGPCAQVSGGTFSSSGAGVCVVQASVAATTNYAAASTTQNVTINPATATITFAAAPMPTYLGGNFMVSATTNSTGAVTYSYVSGPCAQVSGGTFSSVGGGVCVVQAGVAATTNYTAASATQNVTINPATPTIAFGAAPSATYPGSNFVVSATTNSNGALTYSYVSGPCAQVSGGTFSPSGAGSCIVQASTAATTNFLAGSATETVSIASAGQTNPIITWPAPAPITYGMPLSSTQLDATANVAGTFVYNPPAKTILTAGMHTLSVTFTPTNTSAYNTVTATVSLEVNQATPPVLWVPVPIVYGTPLGPLQLDALTIVPGTFVYTPSAGAILHPGNQPLSATFTPNDTMDFQTITVHATLLVLKATPDVDWSPPAAIVSGTPLSGTQLDATANVPGTFVYNPPAGFILPAGTATLKVTFTPADTADYQSVSAQVFLTVKSKK
ncbi:MAG: beta strand repeat-containing protein [Terriglobia bacterium]